MLNRRKFPRISEEWQIKYRVIDAEEFRQNPFNGFSLNVSGGGICFKATESMKPNVMLAIEMQSPTFDSPIIALAEVVWCKPRKKGDVNDVGAEFWWVGWKNNDAQTSIYEYIKVRTEDDSNST